MEASLLKHPFELYPHLEESITNPEVLQIFSRNLLRCDYFLHIDQQLREDVVTLLDPELKQEFSELEVNYSKKINVCSDSGMML